MNFGLYGFPVNTASYATPFAGSNYHQDAILALNPSIYFPLDDTVSNAAPPRNLGSSNNYTFSHNLSAIATLSNVNTPWGVGIRYAKETTPTDVSITSTALITGNYSIGCKFYAPNIVSATDYIGLLSNHGRGFYLSHDPSYVNNLHMNQIEAGNQIVAMTNWQEHNYGWINLVMTFQETPSNDVRIYINGFQEASGTGARQTSTSRENKIVSFFPNFYGNSSSFYMILKDFFLVNSILSAAQVRSILL